MRCPECHTNNEPTAAACASCGLLMIAPPIPVVTKRRAEDFASQRRRAADRDHIPCQFCHGEVTLNVSRCRHCGEIINEDYYRKRAQRLRARVNYASWVAYLFGLAALLVFRSVGLLSIAGGLLLSIVYYAIPVEPPEASARKKSSFGARLKRQLKMERVAIPLPHLRNKKLVFVGTPLVAALIGYSANLFLLQEPMNEILHSNAAFQGMNVSAHYEYWVVPGVVVYDLREVSVRQTPIDVHTALLEFAKKVRARRYRTIQLSYRGIEKFEIDGNGFRRLGEEYARRNFDYVLYAFPRLFRAVLPARAVNTNASERDALVQFHRQWYGQDQMTRTVANGL